MGSGIDRWLPSLKMLSCLMIRSFYAAVARGLGHAFRLAIVGIIAMFCLLIAFSIGMLPGSGAMPFADPDRAGLLVFLSIFLVCIVAMIGFAFSRRRSASPASKAKWEAAMGSAMSAFLFLGPGYLCSFYFWSPERQGAARWLQGLEDPARRAALALSMMILLAVWIRLNRAARGPSALDAANSRARSAALLAECYLMPLVVALAIWL